MKKDKSKPNIDSESLTIKNPIYIKSNKSIYVAFDKCFTSDNINLNKFNITKAAYNKNADEICRYANVFMKYYDKDKEFLSALLQIKWQIDSMKFDYYRCTFEKDILVYLLSDTIIEKIYKMVDDYYDIDLTSNKKLKNVDLHVLQFCNEHGKTIMALSIACKLTIPVVCHYWAVNADNIILMSEDENDYELNGDVHVPNFRDYLYKIFASYFPLFENGFDLFNKLTMTVNSHLTSTRNSEKVMWKRAANRKITPTSYLDKLMTSVVVDLIPKAIFKKNIIYLIQVAIPQQIKTMLTAKDLCDYCDISVSSRNDELSGLEKMEANSARVSDLDIIISNINIRDSIKKIQKKYNIKISKEELKYYKDHLRSFAFSEIILQFFAKYFGGVYDLKSISKKDYIKLVIIFKKMMKDMGYIYIHQIMTGNISSTIKKRRISSKQLKKIEMSYKFQKAMENYSMGMDIENNTTIKVIAALINTPIEYVDYEHNERLNQNIIADPDIVADEYLNFIKLL